jgi:hypothetical protein
VHLSRDNDATFHNNPIPADPTVPAIVNVTEQQQLLYKEIELLMKKVKTH